MSSPGSNGVKTISKIKTGPFAGRRVGGGTRRYVYGNRYYGCGYPGRPAYCTVVGRDLSFYYPPVVWIDPSGTYSGRYPYNGQEYPTNSTRLGGQLMTLQLQSNQTYSPPTVLHVLADNATLISLNKSITSKCKQYLGPRTMILQYNGTGGPFPEQVAQYYRGSSVALTVDGYNNTAALIYVNNMTQAPALLPPTIDLTLLNCVNSTIGANVPLVAMEPPWYKTVIGIIGLLGLIFFAIILGIAFVYMFCSCQRSMPKRVKRSLARDDSTELSVAEHPESTLPRTTSPVDPPAYFEPETEGLLKAHSGPMSTDAGDAPWKQMEGYSPRT
ncbi:hypothetical protein FA95DRAFT_1548213 [Auriscalpium vulgare]|uniref:Uncharacterized protein n=1 Tax=Auriscalpium vulgare TaxID=40419 RepID=A0ACB8RDY4_9AGAM|nr:hypothetical protein FA95DRAFT_1548213 [Auriscalpium vulgare]